MFVENAAPGLYRVSISHKGTLVDAPQAYSLVWSGMTPTESAVDVAGSRFEMFPGLLPDPNPPFQVATAGGEERGIFITVFEDILVSELGIRAWIPCPAEFFAAVYEAGGVVVDPISGRAAPASMGQAIAEGSATSYHPGWDFHYVPLNVELQACQDYYVSFQMPQNVLSWPWYNEGLLGGPLDLGGAIRLRDGAYQQNPANGAMPLVSFIAEADPDPGDTVSDLTPPNTQFSVCTDSSFERGIYIEPTKTIRVQSVGFEASVVGGALFTAKIYNAADTTRGELIAKGSRMIDNSPLQMHSVPIGATLYEGRQYDVVMEFAPATWACESDLNVVPYTIDNTIVVVDGERAGDASSPELPHMTITWREGAGGAPFDLGKQNGVFPPPFTDTSDLYNYGVYIKNHRETGIVLAWVVRGCSVRCEHHDALLRSQWDNAWRYVGGRHNHIYGPRLPLATTSRCRSASTPAASTTSKSRWTGSMSSATGTTRPVCPTRAMACSLL